MTHNTAAIYTRTYDYLTWILPATNHFPKSVRHSFTRRLLDASFDLREYLEEANLRRGQARKKSLLQADESLAKIRVYIRLANRWKWLSEGQYEHVSLMLVEIGKILGGWRKATS